MHLGVGNGERRLGDEDEAIFLVFELICRRTPTLLTLVRRFPVYTLVLLRRFLIRLHPGAAVQAIRLLTCILYCLICGMHSTEDFLFEVSDIRFQEVLGIDLRLLLLLLMVHFIVLFSILGPVALGEGLRFWHYGNLLGIEEHCLRPLKGPIFQNLFPLIR